MAYRYATSGSMETSASAMPRGEKRTHRRRENLIPSGTMMVDEYDRAERFTRINIDDVDQRKALEQWEAIRQKEEGELQYQQRLERRKRRFEKEAEENENASRKMKDDKKSIIRLKPKDVTVVSDSPEPKRNRSPESVEDSEEAHSKKRSQAKERMKEKLGRSKYFDELKAKLAKERNKIRSSNGDTSLGASTKTLPCEEKNESLSPAAIMIPSLPKEKKAPAASDVLKTDACEAAKSSDPAELDAPAPSTGQGPRRADNDFRRNRPAPPVKPKTEVSLHPNPNPKVIVIEPKSPPTLPDPSRKDHSAEKAADTKNTTLPAAPTCVASKDKAPLPKRDVKTVIPSGGSTPPKGEISSAKAVTAIHSDSEHKDVNVEAKPLRSKRFSAEKPVSTGTGVTRTRKTSPDVSNIEQSDDKTAGTKKIALPAAPTCAASNDKVPLSQRDAKSVIPNGGGPPRYSKIFPTKVVAINHSGSDHKDSNVEPETRKSERSSPEKPVQTTTNLTGTGKPSLDAKDTPCVAKPSQVPFQASQSVVTRPTKADGVNHGYGEHKDVDMETKSLKNEHPCADKPVQASAAAIGTGKSSLDAKASSSVAKPSQIHRPAPRSAVALQTQEAAGGQAAASEQRKFKFTPIVFNQKKSQPSSRPVQTAKPVAIKPPTTRCVPSEPTSKLPSKGSSTDAPLASRTAPSKEKPPATPTVTVISIESCEKSAEASGEAAPAPTHAQSSSKKAAVAKSTISSGPPHGVESTTKRSVAPETTAARNSIEPAPKASSARTANVLKNLGKPAPRMATTPNKAVTKADITESAETSNIADAPGLKRTERHSEEDEPACKRRETESSWAKYGAELTVLEEALLEMRPDLISTLDDELRTISRDFADPAAFDRELRRLEGLL